ncbi:hypothetical protein O181_092539 [Austropuccinia psidii MF-1]|uniref:Uncharacterized protein n=1 Tax=Austropuccinia psidii MF-1 TaxID=1389203 RepID=A0A9Q3IZG5_9BASI|nr:hypothetical protein [Austropuccinia psidii MF-1]
MKEIKCWNPNKNSNLLEEIAASIKDNQEAIQAIEKYWHMEEEFPSSPHQTSSSRPYKPMATSSKAHHSSLVVFSRRQGAQGKKQSFFQPYE